MIILINRQFTYAVFLYSKPQDMFEIIVSVTQTLDVLLFFSKKVLSDARSEVQLVRRYIVSTRESVRG